MKKIKEHDYPISLLSLFIYRIYKIKVLSDKIFYYNDVTSKHRIKTKYRAYNYLLTGIMIKKYEIRLNIFQRIFNRYGNKRWGIRKMNNVQK